MVNVSVVIPAYNASRTLGRALASVARQTRRPAEVLVVDDGSLDDPAEVVAGFDFARLIRRPNGGAAAARNTGIEQARGDAIAFLDADDFWEPEKLARQLAVLDQHPEVGLVASRYFHQAPGGNQIDPPPLRKPPTDVVLRLDGPEAFDLATQVWTTSVLVRREVLGDHRFVSGLEPAEDRDLWARLVVAAPAYLISTPLATLVLEPGSLSRSSIDVDCGNMLRVIHRHAHLLGRRGVRTWEAHTYFRWSAIHLSRQHYREAVRPACSRLVRQPLAWQGWYFLARAAIGSSLMSMMKLAGKVQP